jgi:hypothetical protein
MKAVLQAKRQGEIHIWEICRAAGAQNTAEINAFLDALLDEGSQWPVDEIMEIVDLLMERKHIPRKRYDTDGIIKRLLKEMEGQPADGMAPAVDEDTTAQPGQSPDRAAYARADRYLRHIQAAL